MNNPDKKMFVAEAGHDSSRVHHPNYYKLPNGIECHDVVKYFDFDTGNMIKYAWRAGRKEEEGMTTLEKELEDIKKVREYADLRIKDLENEINKTKQLV